MRSVALFVVLALAAGLGAAGVLSASAQDRPPESAEPDPTQRDLASYRLRVDDEVTISVYNPGTLTADVERPVIVPANGEVSFPPLGRLQLLGKTPFRIEEEIAQRLKEQNYLQNPNVGCFVTRYAERTVSVIGALQRTVPLPIHRNMRILELLAQTTGNGLLSSPDADFTQVRIRRIGNDGKPFTIEINVDDVLQRNDETKNVVVKEGDILIVPRLETATPISSEWVYVLGKVGTPGRHPLVKGRTPFTLTKLIAIVGDFTEFANRSRVKIIRTTETGRQFHEIDFDDIIEGERPDFEMRADDVVYVPESFL